MDSGGAIEERRVARRRREAAGLERILRVRLANDGFNDVWWDPC